MPAFSQACYRGLLVCSERIAGVAPQGVITGAALNVVIAATTKYRIGAISGLDGIVSVLLARKRDGGTTPRHIFITGDNVVTVSARQHIIASATGQLIAIITAVKVIVTAFAKQMVVATTTQERIIALQMSRHIGIAPRAVCES